MCSHDGTRWFVCLVTSLVACLCHLHSSPDFPEDKLQTLCETLVEKGFQPYITTMGGSGLGVLWPREGEAVPTLAMTPGGSAPSLRQAFEEVPKDKLSAWATAHGRWVYV